MQLPIFDPTNSTWQGFARVMDLFGLSICFLLCSLPLVTLGASTAALYDSVYHGVRRGESGAYARFFRTFARELRTTVPITLAGLALALLYLFASQVSQTVAASGDSLAAALVYAYQVLFCVPLAVWIFAMAAISRFSFRPMALVRTAARLVFSRLPSAAAVTALALLAWRVMTWWYFSLLFLPALTALLISLPMERVFAPYLEEAEEEQEGQPL